MQPKEVSMKNRIVSTILGSIGRILVQVLVVAVVFVVLDARYNSVAPSRNNGIYVHDTNDPSATKAIPVSNCTNPVSC